VYPKRVPRVQIPLSPPTIYVSSLFYLLKFKGLKITHEFTPLVPPELTGLDRQLAHAARNAVSAAYNLAKHLADLSKTMHAWADYLDGLKAGAEIIPLFKHAK
jgi:hypothetical protein